MGHTMTIRRTLSFFVQGLPADLPIQTERLSLATKTQSLADAETNDRARLSDLLSAKVPDTWPPQFVTAPGPEDGPGWENLYVLRSDNSDGEAVLVGIAGMSEWTPEKIPFRSARPSCCSITVKALVKKLWQPWGGGDYRSLA
jgi:hypothetical protein